jgi:hypothetical protein
MIVLYIAGAGRSGSTLIELILGNLQGYFSVGEVRHLWEYYAQKNRLCGCGTPLDTCPIWSKVVSESGLLDKTDSNHLYHLTNTVDRTRSLLQLSTGFYNRQVFADLVDANRRLYQAISRVSGADIIVDSSKTPSHLFVLSKIPEIDLRVLHLVRDGRAVAYAWNKRVKVESAALQENTYMPKRSTYLSLVRWAMENLYAMSFSKNLALHTTVRYEDLISAPYAELKRGLNALHLDPPDLEQLKDNTLTITSTHSVGGNPIRFDEKTLRIKADESWKTQISPAQKFMQGLFVFPVLRKYGYPLF